MCGAMSLLKASSMFHQINPRNREVFLLCSARTTITLFFSTFGSRKGSGLFPLLVEKLIPQRQYHFSQSDHLVCAMTGEKKVNQFFLHMLPMQMTVLLPLNVA